MFLLFSSRLLELDNLVRPLAEASGVHWSLRLWGMPRTSSKMEWEVWVKEEGKGCRKHVPACVQHHMHSLQLSVGWLGLRSVIGSSWPRPSGAYTDSIEPVGGFWITRVLQRRKLYPMRPLESKMAQTEHWTLEKYMVVYLQVEWHICLVEMIDANRKKTIMEKGWQSVGSRLIWETYHFTFTATVCMLKPISVPIIPTTVNVIVLAAVKVRLRVIHRYTHTIHLLYTDTPSRVRCKVMKLRHLKADMMEVCKCMH